MIWLLLTIAVMCGAILFNQGNIMSQISEATEKLVQLATAITGIKADVTKVGTEIDALKAALANGGTTSPEFEAALASVFNTVDSLKATVKAVDDLNPDAPVPDPVPTPV
jgi:ABC-type transporter Mla subunit MlaD